MPYYFLNKFYFFVYFFSLFFPFSPSLFYPNPRSTYQFSLSPPLSQLRRSLSFLSSVASLPLLLLFVLLVDLFSSVSLALDRLPPRLFSLSFRLSIVSLPFFGRQIRSCSGGGDANHSKRRGGRLRVAIESRSEAAKRRRSWKAVMKMQPDWREAKKMQPRLNRGSDRANLARRTVTTLKPQLQLRINNNQSMYLKNFSNSPLTWKIIFALCCEQQKLHNSPLVWKIICSLVVNKKKNYICELLFFGS